ncbi:hypothetical protein GCM10023220_43980 [Streptomyces ziwulingensis]|uniref:Secreted protein n=1 Tax=Streptomyces ziwulingensis TaxID=1045501 RepID=A0ABP9CFU0_9ACTN
MLKWTTVAALTVLALTGFSTGRGHGGGGSGSDSGGGCSSSSQDHDNSSSTSGGSAYKDDDEYGDYDDTSTPGSGSGGSTVSVLQDATVKLVSCASADRPYATVEVTNPNSRSGTFSASVDFLDATHTTPLDFGYVDVTVPAGATRTAKVPVDAGHLDALDHCAADETAAAA